MTFIETTSFFLRVMKFDFQSRKDTVNLKFRLIPMFHIGSEDYYQEVMKLVNECDELIYEGMKIQQIKALTNQYKKVAKKLDLVVQFDGLKKTPINKNIKLIHADYNESSGQEAWKTMRFTERLKFKYIRPIQLVILSKIITRKWLADNNLHSNQKIRLAYSKSDTQGTSEYFIMKTRDDIVIQTIQNKYNKESKEDKLVGVMYGAEHMKKISRFLIDELDYIGNNGTFIKVFDID
jgi:hypothetical protein